MDRWIEVLRHAIRSLRRAAGFTAISVGILALGIGTATAGWTVFRAVVIERLPLIDPDRVVSLELQGRSGRASLSVGEIAGLGRESSTLQDVGGVSSIGAVAIPLTEADRPLVLNMSRVTANYFEVLGARPVLGRLLRPEDGEEGAARVAVIGYDAWHREFGGDPGVVSRRLTQTQYRESYAIVGVAPPGLDYPVGVDYWIVAGTRDAMEVVGRVAPGATADIARAEFLSIARSIDARLSNPRSPLGATVRLLSDVVIGDARPILVAITAAVGLLLLIACVNVGNLLLMRATQRSHDVVVRRALGASSGRIARLFLVEAALLAAAAGTFGLVLAVALLRIAPAVAPASLPRNEMIGLAGAPVAGALVATLIAVLLSGVVPAVAATRADLGSVLRSGRRGGTGTRTRRRVRRTLVAAQVALAVVMLFGAGLLMRTLGHLYGLELGYDTEGVAIVELSFNRENRESPAETFALLDGVLERMRGVPGTSAATPIMSRPFLGETAIFATRPMIEGQTEADVESHPRVPLEVGEEELFRTLGIPIIRGRGLLDTDREGAPRVAVVSRAVAERLWHGRDPVGERIRMVTGDVYEWTVVGVAGDTRFRRLREPTPTIYVHYRQLQILPAVWTVAVRTDADVAMALPAMRRAVRDFDPRIDVWRVAKLNDHMARGPLARPRMSAILLSGLGLAALLLAAIGLYAVMALAVRERTHELGVRKALGASATRLRTDVLGDALAVTVAGTVVGLAVALVASRAVVSLLFGVRPADPVTLLGVCAMLLAVAVIAAYLPASRATRVDPMHALRSD